MKTDKARSDKILLSDLFDKIIEVCRKYAKEMPRFEDGDGAIRISYLPQSEFGFKLSKPACKKARRCEVVTSISENGNIVRDRHTAEPVDSSGLSALKVASCLRDQEGKKEDKFRDEKHGFSPYGGAASYQLLFDHKIFAVIIVSVSGSIPAEEEAVAKAASGAIEEWCKNGPRKDERPQLFYLAH